MKKLFSFFAAVTAAVCLLGACKSETKDQAVYSINLEYAGNNNKVFSSKSSEEVKALYEEISNGITAFKSKYDSEWSVNIINKEYSSADKSALDKFNTAAAELKSFEESCKAKIAALADDEASMFAISKELVVHRSSVDGTKDLGTQTFSVSYPTK